MAPRRGGVLALILGGGQGTRLYPLTKQRAKPAVPLAGKYRLIDVPISNCLNSGLENIYVLTQFNSVSLHRHIQQTYKFDVFSTGWVQMLAAEQTPRSSDWYQGTADAVRKQLVEIQSFGPDHVLILSGDHLYRMDYGDFASKHIEADADISVAVYPVSPTEATRFGLLKTDEDNWITDFVEKPKDPAVIADFSTGSDPANPCLASMGVYIFKTDVLIERLTANSDPDFGKHILPQAIGEAKVLGYDFDDYWEDIGTIRSFFESNLALTEDTPPFNFDDLDAPIYSHPRFLPNSRVTGNSDLRHTIVSDGCRIDNARLERCVIGIRSRVMANSTMRNVVMLGGDYYETAEQIAENRALGRPDIGIGPNSRIEDAIIDKNARIGANVTIRSVPDRDGIETDQFVARDGIVVIPKNAIIPDNTVI